MSKLAMHRVVCAIATHEMSSITNAESHLAAVERIGGCHLLHTIEVRVGDEWIPRHIARAREILAAPVGAGIDSPDGPLIKTAGSWSQETSARALADVSQGFGDPDALLEALGPHEEATLTVDGRAAYVTGWCSCPAGPPVEDWIRYERWTDQGRAGHGYVCSRCRFLTQAG